jgi:hypothetical protein
VPIATSLRMPRLGSAMRISRGHLRDARRVTRMSTASSLRSLEVLDHDKGSAFALQGAHRTASCGSCHKLTRLVGGKQLLFYKPTPKECAACHKPGTLERTKTAVN